jgi:hypothetical protein
LHRFRKSLTQQKTDAVMEAWLQKLMSLSEKALQWGESLAGARGESLADTLNHGLGQFIGDDYKTVSAYVIGLDGKRSDSFAAVIHRAAESADVTECGAVPANATAAVIDVCDELDLESFRAAYGRIADAKKLKKTAVPKGEDKTNVTLGIVLTARSAIPLDTVAEELDRLNSNTPSSQWPDMIVIASTGIINYGVQFPGESISGDFLPPAEGALTSYVPSIYVLIVMRPTGTYAFNKMLAFLLVHLGIFSPEAKLPPWVQILEGVPENVVTLTGFQYNLNGDLMPVPRQFYNDRYLPPRSLLIQDQQGNVLSTIQYMPWQDGGTVLLRGKLPLEGLLVFLGKSALRGGVIKRPALQISHVLPLTRADFGQFLERFQRQSNMIVRNDSGHVVFQKLSDEGSSSCFMARIYLGILHLRDAVFSDPATRVEFDKIYDFVISAVTNARTASQNILRMWDEHTRKIRSGEIVHQEGTHIQIAETIDKDLRREVEGFLNAGTRALKTGMQNIGKCLNVDIGFLFRKSNTFEKGITELGNVEPDLAEYLRHTRVWSEPLLKSRNDLEHESEVLSRVTYTPTDSGLAANEPVIADMPVTQFVAHSFDRLISFVEEFAVYCLNRQLPPLIAITEIPLADRLVEAPERFRVTLTSGGLPPWRIAFHATSFEET